MCAHLFPFIVTFPLYQNIVFKSLGCEKNNNDNNENSKKSPREDDVDKLDEIAMLVAC